MTLLLKYDLRELSLNVTKAWPSDPVQGCCTEPLSLAGNKMCTSVVSSVLIWATWADCSASQTTAHPVHGEYLIFSTKLTRPGALRTGKLWSCSFSVLVNSFYLNTEVPLCWLLFFPQFSPSSHWEVERANNCVVLSCYRVKPQQVTCRTVPSTHPPET